jgi:hypothetical protein
VEVQEAPNWERLGQRLSVEWIEQAVQYAGKASTLARPRSLECTPIDSAKILSRPVCPELLCLEFGRHGGRAAGLSDLLRAGREGVL